MDSDLDELAARASAGDLDARNVLYVGMEDYMFRLAAPAERAARAAPTGQIEVGDLHQEIFVIFCSLLEEWRSEQTPFAGFVGAKLPNRAWHYVRKLIFPRSVPLPETSAGDGDATELRADADPGETYTQNVFCTTLLAHLDPLSRQVMVMHGILGMEIAEVAERLCVSNRTAYRLYAAARYALRWALAEDADFV